MKTLLLTIYKNTETGDLIISGVGELHLDVAIEKLLNKFGVTAKLYQPAIAYRETIRGTSKVEGKHKKTKWWTWSIWRCLVRI